MARYVTRPKQLWWYDDEAPKAPALPHPQIFAGGPINTGLLDKEGNELFRDPAGIGFLAFDKERQSQ